MLKTFKYDNDSVRLLKKIHTLIIERKFIIFSPFLKKAHNSNKTSSGTHTHRLAIVITVTDCNCKLPSTMIIQSGRFYFYWQKIQFFLINKYETIDQTMDGYNFFLPEISNLEFHTAFLNFNNNRKFPYPNVRQHPK